MLKLVTPFKNCGEVCDHCGKSIERGQRVVYTMDREPALYWHAGDCYRLGVKPLDLRTLRDLQKTPTEV
jgi:hypothetical protein